MVRTIYSLMSSNDLVAYCLLRNDRSELETELAQRLYVALLMLEETDGNDARGPCKGGD